MVNDLLYDNISFPADKDTVQLYDVLLSSSLMYENRNVLV